MMLIIIGFSSEQHIQIDVTTLRQYYSSQQILTWFIIRLRNGLKITESEIRKIGFKIVATIERNQAQIQKRNSVWSTAMWDSGRLHIYLCIWIQMFKLQTGQPPFAILSHLPDIRFLSFFKQTFQSKDCYVFYNPKLFQ